MAPNLSLRDFDVRDVEATHIRLRVRDNQCTGGPGYQAAANPMQDPVLSNPDCDSEEMTPDRAVLDPPKEEIRAELQVFGEPAGRVSGKPASTLGGGRR